MATAKSGPAGGRLHDGVDEHGAVVRPQFRDGPRARHDLATPSRCGARSSRNRSTFRPRCRAAMRSMAGCRGRCAWSCRTAIMCVGAYLVLENEMTAGMIFAASIISGPRAAAARPDHRRLAPGHRCQPRLEAAEEHRQGQCRQRDKDTVELPDLKGAIAVDGRHLFPAERRPHRRSADQEDQLPRRARRSRSP